MSSLNISIVRFCCEEITRQQDTALAVVGLVAAWEDAIEHQEEPLTLGMIERWGLLAKPALNSLGFRRHNVQVGGYVAPDWRDVPRLMAEFMESVFTGRFLPAEAYYEYEMIHPFADGNGRTGKILYNFLSGALLSPSMPPNYFGHNNP